MHVWYKCKEEEIKLAEAVKELIRQRILKNPITNISATAVKSWGDIELLTRLGVFHDKELRKKFANSILSMDIPNWIKIWILMKVGVPQDESEYPYGFMRMVLYGVWSKELETYEETPQRQLELSPLEAFFFKLHQLIKLAEETKNWDVVEKLQRVEKKVITKGDFSLEDCKDLRGIEVELHGQK